MKKGNIHIDWAISIGIFVTYLLLLFIFVRPGQIEEYKGDLLLNIVEKNFKNDFYWRLLEIPVFVNTTDASKTAGSGGLVTGAAIGISGSGTPETLLIDLFPFHFPSNNMLVIDNELNILPFTLEDPLDEQREFIFNVTDFKTDEKLIYKILYSESMNVISTEAKYSDFINVSNATIFGIGEYSIGISEDKFKEISQNYNKLKSDWRYPKLKDFSIIVSDKNEIILLLNNAAPPENVNIYVLQWSDFILYNDTTKKPVTVNVKAW